MSSRFYPRWVAGNPQLRIFLPDFWMVLTRNRSPHAPPNLVTFRVHPRMTEYDVKNYLEKIYKIPVIDIRGAIHMGRYPKAPGQNYVIKEPDYRLCFVQLPSELQFKHPGEDLFQPGGESKEVKEQEKYDKVTDEAREKVRKETWDRHTIPSWFSF